MGVVRYVVGVVRYGVGMVGVIRLVCSPSRQLLCHHYKVYYPVRQHLVQHMVSSMQRLGLTSNVCQYCRMYMCVCVLCDSNVCTMFLCYSNHTDK